MKFEYSKKTGKMEMIKNDEILRIGKNQCFKMLDLIEKKTRVMAHENLNIMDELRNWQDGILKDSYFLAFLNRYYDDINKEESEK